jgi:hypothetical protein
VPNHTPQSSQAVAMGVPFGESLDRARPRCTIEPGLFHGNAHRATGLRAATSWIAGARMMPAALAMILLVSIGASAETGQQANTANTDIEVIAPADTLTGQVASIAAEYGNIETTFDQRHLDALGIAMGNDFIVTRGETSVTVRLGKTYEDVERGEWIALVNWEGKLRLARSFANAAETLGASAGDDLVLAPASTD